MVEKTFTITSETGIHARPATQLVNKATQFSCELTLEYRERTVNLKSIMGVMSLGVGRGAKIVVKADGADEQEALKAIESFITDGLGE